MAFAITGGTFNTASIWDTGTVPTGSEDAYSNGFTIQVSGTVSCNTVRNDASNYYLVNTAVPLMTSNNTPSGTVTVSTQQVGLEGWRAFDRNIATTWATNAVPSVGSPATLTYQFPSTRIIKRYAFRTAVPTSQNVPRDFKFQGSNNGISFIDLDSITGSNVGGSAWYTSTLLVYTTPYLYYRFSCTLVNSGVNVQLTEFEMTESTSTAVGQIVGGTFNLLNGSNLTVTASTGVVVGSTTPTITFALPSGSTASVNATIPAITTVANYAAVQLNGLGTLNFTGDISCGPTSTTNVRVINITAAGTLNYSGVCTNGGNTSNQTNSIYSSAAGTINITTSGFAGGNFLAFANSSVYLNNGGTLNIESSGNIRGGNSPAVTIIGGDLTVNGNVVGGALSPAITNITTATPLININGTVSGGTGSPAITSLGTVQLIGPLINNNGYMAVNAPSLFITSATTYWSFTTSGSTNRILYTDAPTNTTGFPNASDVRLDEIYGPTNTTVGTMNVPLPSDVRINVPTDNTVGTATLTAQDLFDAISGSTSGVGYRLKNIATVATVGKQIASFNI